MKMRTTTHSQSCVFALILALVSVLAVKGSVFRRIGGWYAREKPAATSRCLLLRGGANDKTDGNNKIKGVCIGIDLGTTYR